MATSLRNYQTAASDAVFRYWEAGGGNPLVEVPTGAGKSLIAAEIVRRVTASGKHNVAVVTHRKELIEQDARAIDSLIPNAPMGIWSASVGQRSVDRITVCGVQTAVRNTDRLGKISVAVVDEAHLCSPSANTMYGRFFDGLRKNNPDLRVVGLTATPCRVGQGVLTWGEDKIFDSIVYRVAMRDLVRDGYLSPIVTGKATTQINVDGIGIQAGEYILRDLELAANVDSITQTVASDIAASGRQHVLVFGVSIKHAMALRDALLFAGVDTRVVSGEMPKHERAQILDDFKAGRIRCLASCDVLTTGFDAPSIDCVAIVRATMSPGLFVQMAGRGSRLSPGKQDALLYDYGGNLARHGPIDDINPPKNKVKRGPGDAPFKSCPQCFAECHTMSRVCEHCGFEFPLPERKANKKASELPAMSLDEKAPPKTWEVKRTEYSRHKGKDGKPDTFKVSYFSTENADDDGEDMIPQWKRWPIASEWLCFDHEDGSWPYKKASSWWSSRSQGRVPRSVGDALDCVVDLPETYEITTEAEGKYTRVISAKWKHIEQVSDSTNGGDVDPVQQWVDDCEDLPF